MKVLAINGSPRKDGNTNILLKTVLDEIEKNGIATEIFQLGGNRVSGCKACGACVKTMNRKCIINDDVMNSCIEKMIEADGILIGSPIYFSDITTETKALMDRAGYVVRANGHLLRRKVGAGVIAVRRAGAMHGFDSINHFFLIQQMIIPGSSYWNIGIGREKGDVNTDAEGLNTMKTLGENMAWLLKKLAVSGEACP